MLTLKYGLHDKVKQNYLERTQVVFHLPLTETQLIGYGRHVEGQPPHPLRLLDHLVDERVKVDDELLRVRLADEQWDEES